MAGSGAIGDHRNRQAGRVGRIVADLHVEHRAQPAEALGTDAELVHLLEQLQPQFLDTTAGSAFHQLVDIDRIEQRFLGQHRGLLRGAADTDAEHPGRAPARAHGRHGLQHPVNDRIGGVEHRELGLVLAAAALGRDMHIQRVPGHQLVMNHCRRIVTGVLARTGRIGKDRSAQHVVGIEIGAAHAFVDHFIDRQRCAVPAHVHANPHEHRHDARVLADGAMALGTHARIDQDLRDRIARGRVLLTQPRLVHRLDEVHRMVIRDELQRVGHARDQIFLLDHSHGTAPDAGCRLYTIAGPRIRPLLPIARAGP